MTDQQMDDNSHSRRMPILCRIMGTINRAASILAACILGVILLVLLVQVFQRSVMDTGLPWVNEVATYLLVWAVCLGIGVAFWENAHFTVELVVDRVKRWNRGYRLLLNVSVVFFLVLLIVTGVEVTGSAASRTSPALGLSMASVYAAVPVAGVLSAANLITLAIYPGCSDAQKPDSDLEEHSI